MIPFVKAFLFSLCVPLVMKFSKLCKLKNDQANLPISHFKEQIVQALGGSQVVIIAGDTGCGKSTQVPYFEVVWGWRDHQCNSEMNNFCSYARGLIGKIQTSSGLEPMICAIAVYGVKFGTHISLAPTWHHSSDGREVCSTITQVHGFMPGVLSGLFLNCVSYNNPYTQSHLSFASSPQKECTSFCNRDNAIVERNSYLWSAFNTQKVNFPNFPPRV